MKWASTSGERAALPTSEESLLLEIQGVKILNGNKLVWQIFLRGTMKMQKSSSSLERRPLRFCAYQVLFILLEKKSMQSSTSLTILKFHLLILFSQHKE